MLKKRIIPILLLSRNLLVKTKKFSSDRIVGNILQSIRIFNKRQSDELTFIDIDASRDNGKIEISFMKEIISECNMPISIGGGINSCDEIENLLNIGFDKIIIGKEFVKNINFIENAVKIFGSQSITAGVDIVFKNNKFQIKNSFNNKIAKNLENWLLFLQQKQIGEFLITSVDDEGSISGYNLKLLNHIHHLTNKPILFNGGCKSINDFEKILSYKNVMGACASSIFFFSKITPADVKKKIKKKINIRI